MFLENVPIEKIEPNPLNPRRDYSVKTEEMQEIIKERGWETGITCYKNNGVYVILSGHRRWYAATQLKEKSIPVYVVERPSSKLEELERLGSSQSGKVDWSPYEWAKYTFDLWIMRDKCTYRELALKLKASERNIAERIRVFRYYQHSEIEKHLEARDISISMLSDIIDWIEGLKKKYPDVVEELSETMIRQTMIHKGVKDRFSRSEIRTGKFIEFGNENQIKIFLRTTKMSMREALKLINDEEDVKYGYSKFRQSLEALESAKVDVSYIDSESTNDTKKILSMLEKLEHQVRMKKTELNYFIEN